MTFSTVSRRSKRLPPWLRRRIPSLGECTRIESIVRKYHLHTICREAMCPNRAECYSKGKATFIILGDICTRGCRFCSVTKGIPLPPDEMESECIARAASELGLGHVIVTSVTSDDLPDGGSSYYGSVIRALKGIESSPVVEVLTPDFGGNMQALETVLEAGLDIFSHNIETVRRLYGEIRIGADYDRSLHLLAETGRRYKGVITKSALILGLGERLEEVTETLWDLKRAGCSSLAIGQYLRPGFGQVPVREFIPPERFSSLREQAYRMGFIEVAAGPLVRSSYQDSSLGVRRVGGPVNRANDARRSVL